MKLDSPKLVDQGDPKKERIVIRALGDGNTGNYVLLACHNVSEREVSDGDIPFAFWLQDKAFTSGDLIVIYSKSGEKSEKVNSNGKTSHFFYWGRDGFSWSKDLRPVLIETEYWKFSGD